uniref:Uncharacterized protein n=1 Tax=Anguilla anguilla TaxID=7936 RepID=A0A0E9X852_ANGAN
MHTHTRASTRTHTHARTHARTHTHMHTHTHTHIHTHTRTHKNIFRTNALLVEFNFVFYYKMSFLGNFLQLSWYCTFLGECTGAPCHGASSCFVQTYCQTAEDFRYSSNYDE